MEVEGSIPSGATRGVDAVRGYPLRQGKRRLCESPFDVTASPSAAIRPDLVNGEPLAALTGCEPVRREFDSRRSPCCRYVNTLYSHTMYSHTSHVRLPEGHDSFKVGGVGSNPARGICRCRGARPSSSLCLRENRGFESHLRR